MNFSGKEGHPNIQPSTRTGIQPGTSALGGRDLTTAPTPPLLHCIDVNKKACTLKMTVFKLKSPRNPSFDTDSDKRAQPVWRKRFLVRFVKLYAAFAVKPTFMFRRLENVSGSLLTILYAFYSVFFHSSLAAVHIAAFV